MISYNVVEQESANYRVGQIWSPACFYMAHFYIFKGFREKHKNILLTCENYMKFKSWCSHSFFGNTAASALQQQSLVVGTEGKKHKLQKPKILTL